jgi:toxin HigB-1
VLRRSTAALVGRDKGGYAVNASGNWRMTFGWIDGDAIDVDLDFCSMSAT